MVIWRCPSGQEVVTDSAHLMFSIGSLVPFYGRARMRRRHTLGVGCQGGCGMTGASFETVTPKATGTPASHQGMVSVVIETSHKPSDVSSLPNG